MIRRAHLDKVTDVQLHLARLIPMAATDLGVANPGKLFRRFLGWTLGQDTACRVCAKAGHDFIPRVPPRLVPCDGYAVEPVHKARTR